MFWRAQIVLLTADGWWHSRDHVAHRHQQDSSVALAGTLHDRWGSSACYARQDPSVAPSRRWERRWRCVWSPPHAPDDPPGETTHWTAEAMAKETGIMSASVQRIWRKHGLQPLILSHQARAPSNDPRFAAKLREIVGLYVDPLTHAVVLSIDEKSQIQALDRTQPGLPMKRGARCGTGQTHDYIRHGTTTLFAALNVLDGKVIGQLHAASSASGVHSLPQRHRSGRPCRQADPCHRRQLRCLQASKGKGLAGRASTLDVPLHPNFRILAQRSRRLLRQTDQAALKRGVFQIHRRASAAINRFTTSKPTITRNPSDGPRTQTKSSPPSTRGTKR